MGLTHSIKAHVPTYNLENECQNPDTQNRSANEHARQQNTTSFVIWKLQLQNCIPRNVHKETHWERIEFCPPEIIALLANQIFNSPANSKMQLRISSNPPHPTPRQVQIQAITSRTHGGTGLYRGPSRSLPWVLQVRRVRQGRCDLFSARIAYLILIQAELLSAGQAAAIMLTRLNKLSKNDNADLTGKYM